MSEQKSDMIEAVSLQYLAEVLQGAGYRTNESEQNGGNNCSAPARASVSRSGRATRLAKARKCSISR